MNHFRLARSVKKNLNFTVTVTFRLAIFDLKCPPQNTSHLMERFNEAGPEPHLKLPLQVHLNCLSSHCCRSNCSDHLSRLRHCCQI